MRVASRLVRSCARNRALVNFNFGTRPRGYHGHAGLVHTFVASYQRASLRNQSVAKIIVNHGTIFFFLKLQSACWQFQTITVPECCLIKLLPYILLQKYINILAFEMASPGNRRRSQRTFAPCCQLSCIFSLVVGYLPPALAGNVLQSVVSVRPFISSEEGM